jgi:hypothetical protein
LKLNMTRKGQNLFYADDVTLKLYW